MEQTRQQSKSAAAKADQPGVRDGESGMEYRVAVIERRLGQIEGNMRHMATKADLEKAVSALKVDMEKSIGALKADMEKSLGALKVDMEKSIGALRNEMQELRIDMEKTMNKMLRWGIGVMAAMVCAMLATTGTVVVAMLRLAGA